MNITTLIMRFDEMFMGVVFFKITLNIGGKDEGLYSF